MSFNKLVIVLLLGIYKQTVYKGRLINPTDKVIKEANRYIDNSN